MQTDMDLRISPRTVQQETVEMLRHLIFSGRFKPGARLVETQLCAQLGVSRPSLREALRSLQAERLIEIVPNRGTTVATLSWEDAVAIYEVRELLEIEAAGRCATRISETNLLELKQKLEVFRAVVSGEDNYPRVMAAAQFYAIIMANCGNPIMEEMHRGLLARISFVRGRSMSMNGRAHNSLKEMSEMVDAIARRDEKGAREAAHRHLLQAKNAAKFSMDNEE